MNFHWLLYRDLLKDMHTDGVKSTSDHDSKLVFLFSCPPKFFNKPFEFLLYKTRRSQRVKITEDVTACKEQQSHHSTSSHVVRFCSLQAVTSSVIYYSTHTRENVIYLLNILFSPSFLFVKGLARHMCCFR